MNKLFGWLITFFLILLILESFCIRAIITLALFWLSYWSTSSNLTKNCGFVQNFAEWKKLTQIYQSKFHITNNTLIRLTATTSTFTGNPFWMVYWASPTQIFILYLNILNYLNFSFKIILVSILHRSVFSKITPQSIITI